ncbi:aromatic-ring-hydroxylating dioxygenase subunit beta [Nocardioides sp. YIM 152315]|uniref:aromatic-ring-hydroxylating dioxygenase subunit beta n=1 Tax=Nocardioides sp. YIM 152315 TaxID=3031760 RepID=UPI0023DBE64E|nr:aromatic-ring-hydroxylating dioxygenase subunit beta [Nocardioides sp. YIM 152315]MDF1605849.1 aromatic-ring-hydroxylating dioxygenase subunit beta [Nocardioides sp. YIM 152315]
MTASSNAREDRAIRIAVEEFYAAEAELLDSQNLNAWLASVDDDFIYEVPVPVTRDDPRAPQHSTTGFLSRETRDSIDLWVSRLSPALVDAAYAENPPVRTRHFVTNARVSLNDSNDGEVTAKSNVLLTWGKWNAEMRFTAGERHDSFRVTNDGLRLRRRRVLLDTNVVRLGHFRIIL